MIETSARLLRLLSLLQARRRWSGTELSERLNVTTRTVRRDVERLRDLGYPVEAVQGTAGYRLGAGSTLPPLLLEDDEAVAVVLGLRASAAHMVSGAEEASVQALTKLEQVLPSRLRHRVDALAAATVHAGAPTGDEVPVEVLMTIADACRRQERLRFDYESTQGDITRREVEPHRLINFARRWYLVAFDVHRDDWRTFRVDRLSPRTPAGRRFLPRVPPHGDAVTYLEHQLSTQVWPFRAVVRLYEPMEDIEERIWPGMGALEAEGPESCLLHIGADTPRALLWMITSVDADFQLLEGPTELSRSLRAQAERCAAALRARPVRGT